MNVSSKLAMRTLLRSHGHLGKERVRFQFDIIIEKIHGLHTGPHTIKWTRGGKVSYTKPFQLEKKSKESLLIDQKISLLYTLYRSKVNNNSNSYEAKDSKLSLISLKSGKKNEKTIGKIHFNIAQYAAVPRAEASVTFKLNRKVTADVTIACTFVQLSKMSSGSVRSGMSGTTNSSGEPEDIDDEYSGDEESVDESCSENPFSPVTPAPPNVFSSARNVFKAEQENVDSTPEKSGDSKIAFSGCSSANIKNGNSVCSKEKPEPGKSIVKEVRALRMGTSFPEKKNNVVHSDTDNSSLLREVEETKRELEKCRRLHRTSEEVIKDLRQALSQNELDMKAIQNQHRDALKMKTTEMNEEIANAEARAKKVVYGSAEQVTALRGKVDEVEKAKKEVEEKLDSAQHEIKAMKNDRELDCTYDLLSESQHKLKKALQDQGSTESKLSLEIQKCQDLEKKCRKLNIEISHANVKLEAHIEHDNNTKRTFDELSSLYEKLRENNVALQKEIQEYRDSPPSGELGSENDGNNDELEELKMALFDANCRIAQLETERDESQCELNSASANLQELKWALDRGQSQYSKLEKDFEILKSTFIQTHENLKESHQKSSRLQKRLATMERSSKEKGLENLQGAVTAPIDVHPMYQRIVKVFSEATEAKKTIQRMKEALQEAYDRERASEMEILTLKETIDKITSEIECFGKRETKKKEELVLGLEEAKARAEKAESSLNIMAKQELAYQEEISKLRGLVDGFEATTKSARESNLSVLVSCRNDLQVKKEELETSSERIKSLQRELSVMRTLEASLTARTRELEIETEVITKQAYHEVEVAKNAAQEIEMSRNNDIMQISQYKEEGEDLRVVAETLKLELKREIDKAQQETRSALVEAKENRKMREEAEEMETKYEQELSKLKATIAGLQKSLEEAASENRKLSEKASEEARRVLAVVKEKRYMKFQMDQAKTTILEQEMAIDEQKTRIKSLIESINESNWKNTRSVERIKSRLKKKEEELDDMHKIEEDLKHKLEEQQTHLSDKQVKLTVALKKCGNLSSEQAHLEKENRSLRSQIHECKYYKTKNKKIADAIADENNELRNDLSKARRQLSELPEEIASLRTQLCDSQNKLAAFMAASSADMSRTKSELEEVKTREVSYKHEIEKKEELIENLTSRLTEAIGKKATESALAQSELTEALNREESSKLETKKFKEQVEQLEEEMMLMRSANAYAKADFDADLTEALSREETYQLQQKKLKKTISKLEASWEREKQIVMILKAEENSCARCSEGSGSILKHVDERTAAGMRADKTMAEVLGGIGESLSSSNIRNADVFEKITDARLLEMLVETKMKLALAEEEKLQLEHLLRRIREGDKHVQNKLAQQASKLELKLTKANQMIDCMQDEKGKVSGESKQPGNKKDGTLEREKAVLQRERIQDDCGQSGNGRLGSASPGQQTKGKRNKKAGAAGKKQPKPPVDEWDIGDDKTAGGSNGTRLVRLNGLSSYSPRSSSIE